MADLTAAKRKALPAKDFAGKKGSSEEFPMPDAEHARLAIGGATRAERAGNISTEEEARIKAKARKKLGKKQGSGDEPALAKELSERLDHKDRRVRASEPRRKGVMGKPADDAGDHEFR